MIQDDRLWLCAALLSAFACRGAVGPLPRGAALEPYVETDAPESYVGPSLYVYMNGGAEIYHEYGFSRLWVGRYARDSRELVVELFEMRDPSAASGVMSFARRVRTEVDLAGGCRASVTTSEAKLAKGRYFLVCRAQDPMINAGDLVRDLCARIAGKLAGECRAADLFAALPADRRVIGSEMQIAGPVGLNVRPWLGSVGREGFKRGWLALYELPAGNAEALLAEYDSAGLAEESDRRLKRSPRAGQKALCNGRRLVLVQGENLPSEQVAALAARLAAPSS